MVKAEVIATLQEQIKMKTGEVDGLKKILYNHYREDMKDLVKSWWVDPKLKPGDFIKDQFGSPFYLTKVELTDETTVRLDGVKVFVEPTTGIAQVSVSYYFTNLHSRAEIDKLEFIKDPKPWMVDMVKAFLVLNEGKIQNG